MERPTYVLVHGAWHGAWCWRDLGAELDRRGVAWRALDLPSAHDDRDGSANLVDDAAAVTAAARDAGPVILVGHSYAGAVVSEAATALPDLRGLIFVAALIPGPGQSATDASHEVRVRTAMDDTVEADGPWIRVRPEGAALAFYGECPAPVQAWAIERVGRHTTASFRQARQSPDADAARRYVLCEHDRAIDPSLQEVMARRCDDVVRLGSDHSPFLSHPGDLADAILG
ncbi:MAG: alpha/beta fold hydrolase [Acidimicrobiales bacterium]